MKESIIAAIQNRKAKSAWDKGVKGYAVELVESLEVSSIERRIGESGFEVEGRDTAIFELTFPNVEPLLFSTLVESHYLGVCLGLRRPDVDTRALLTLVVRSFHHYFQGESLRVPMKIALISASK